MFKFTKIIFVAALLVGTTVFGSSIEKNYNDKTINSIFIDCPARTYVILGKENSLMINGEKAALSRIRTDIKNKTLRIIGNTKDYKFNYEKITVAITLKDFNKIENISSGMVQISSAKKLNNVEIINKGTSTINVNSLQCNNLKLSVKGESEIVSTGRIVANDVKVDLDSETRLNLYSIEAQNIILNDNSKYNIEFNKVVAAKALNLKISSFGGVKIKQLATKNLTVNSDRMGYFYADIINKFQSDNINLSLKSAGIIFLNGINAKNLNVDIGSSGDLKVTGEVNKQFIRMKGSGSFYAHRLKSKNLDIVNYDVGNAYVYATNKAKIKIRGCGDIYLYGNPAKTKDLRGCLGKLKKIVD
jgi:hypothetical protein